ncbi:phage tail tube protein [Quatrionicoccus australiensis]|uniref:phage tail tube protein n=1 Tax=Quatrionicoccus australiensis TaxID=138118 RepID=UPI001CF89A43|nr:hypothetical protein [Quatrionicoccus australiensis]UCV13766.1 hypothetical protein KI612_12455 [Quatrionicoccus australiensis]
MSTSQHRIFKGTVYGADFKTPLELVAFGNAAKCTYSVELEEKSVPDYENPGGGNQESYSRVKAAKLTLELKKVSVANLALALGGSSTAIAAVAVVDEVHTAKLGCLTVLNKPQDTSAALTVKPALAGAAYVEGVDYIRKRAGIITLEGGGIEADESLKISYAGKAGHRVEALVDLTREHHIFLDGIDEVSGETQAPDFYRVKFQPAKSLEHIGDDFVSLTLEGQLLKDESKTGVGISQYTNITTGY